MKLQLGSKGNFVLQLQTALHVKSKTGFFGNITKNAVIAFQQKNKLTPDGIVGAKTWYAIFPTLAPPPINHFNKNLDLQKLKGIVPDEVISTLNNLHLFTAEPEYLHVVHFLAQAHHESAGWTRKDENLNYSAAGLKRVFHKYFKDSEFSTYAKKPKAIANRVYANRMGNGDETSGDGWKHRGLGWIQSTGKTNHKRFGDWIGKDIVNNPELIEMQYPTEASLFFFTDNDIWDITEKGTTDNVIREVTRIINPALRGLTARLTLFRYYQKVLFQ